MSEHTRDTTITDVDLTVFRWSGLQSVTYTRQSTPAGGESHIGLVSVRTAGGVVGHAFLGSSFRPVDIDARAFIDVLKPAVVGEDALDRERLNRALYSRARAVMLRTIGAMDVALWDIAGKCADLPIHRLIGRARDGLPAYASSWTLPSVEAYVEQALQVKERGYRGYKMHPPHDRALHVPMLRAVRKALGDDFPLMYDPAMIYSFPEALRIGRVLEELGYLWFEDPLPIDDIYNYAKLCEALDIAVMATEYTPAGFQGYAAWILAKATDALRGDVAVKGGLTACLKAAHLAEAFNMNFELHHGGNSLNNVANLQLALAIANCDYFEVLLPDGAQQYGLVEDLAIDAAGMMRALPGPGLGGEIDFDLIRRNTAAVLR
jgi:L-alanine-DL-glutamate epimerase-like enolase superfamily enzyme